MQANRYRAIRAAQLRTVGTSWVRRRPWLLGPQMAANVAVLFATGYPRDRLGVIAGLYTLMFAFKLYASVRAMSCRVTENQVVGSHLVLFAPQAVVLAMTGGLASPLLPSIFPIVIGTMVIFGRSRQSAATIALVAATVIGLAFVPPSLRGTPVTPVAQTLLMAITVLYTLHMIWATLTAFGDVYWHAGESLEKARADVVARAKGRARSLEAIGAKVAHELKNPLSAVKGLVQLMAKSDTDARRLERLGVIDAEVTRMEDILRDYLSFSRPLEDLSPEPVELHALVDEVFSVLEGRAEVAGVVTARVGMARVVGDERRLKDALFNLITNAIEATPAGGHVTVALRANGEGAEVAIHDEGPGLDAEQLARIGKPFFTTRQGGTGLGVVLARTVVRQHGGDVRYTSARGRGTTTTVGLPLRPTEANCIDDGTCPAGR